MPTVYIVYSKTIESLLFYDLEHPGSWATLLEAARILFRLASRVSEVGYGAAIEDVGVSSTEITPRRDMEVVIIW